MTTPTVQERLGHYFNNETQARRFSGSVLIANDDRTLLRAGYGYADFERGIKNTPSTLFVIGSMTKAFVALSILMLEERGLVDTEKTLDTYVPEYKMGSRVTLHMALQHCAGVWCFLQDMNSPFWQVMDQYHTPAKLLDYINNRPLVCQPGTKYAYSNSGYVLLGIIIERVSGLPFAEFISRNILAPLQMTDTAYDPFEQDHAARVATGYENLRDDPLVTPRKLHVSVTYTSGGIVSTVDDLYKWERSLYKNKLISYDRLNRIFTPGLGNYGYGWWIDTLRINNAEYKQIWHWGCSSGYHGIITRLVQSKITIIMLQNFTSPELYTPESPDSLLRLRDGVIDILFA